MNPYPQGATKTDNVEKFFRVNESDFSMTFVGESLELWIPSAFEKHGMLEIGENVTTIGVMGMLIDGKYHTGLNILAPITISPSDMRKTAFEGVEYLVLTLQTGDTFMTSYRVVQNPQIIFVIWTEIIERGKLPFWFTYESLLKIFEHARAHTGSGIGVSQSVFEGIIAHISRDPHNISKQYRLTEMQEPFQLVALSSISNATTGTVARLNGSYFRNEGLTSALRNQVEEQQPFENLLRGISSSVYESRDGAVS